MTDQPKSNQNPPPEGVRTNKDYLNDAYKQVMSVQGKLASGKRELPADQSVVDTNLDEQRRILERLVSGSKRKASDAQNLDVSNNPTPAP